MRGILVILDGMGDLPCKQFGGKTPLDAANTPNLDFLATRGELGYMHPVKSGFAPGSDEAIVSIFGNDLASSTRGQLEARGAGINLTRGDLALRVNFATVGSFEKKELLDRRAGRTLTTAEAKILAKALNKIKLPCRFVFEPTIQHRAVLVFRGGFSDNFLGNDPHPFTGKFRLCKVLDDDENSQYSVNIVNEFLEKAYEVLDKHPINRERRKKGLFSANYLLVRCPGIEAPKVKLYRKWASPSYMPVEMGFSQVSGMKVFSFDYPKLKKLDVYSNVWSGLKKACYFNIKILKRIYKKFDYVYMHLKETDVAGHDNKPVEKKLILEYIDKTLFKFLRRFAIPRKIKIVVTADHSTPCKLKKHSANPVPVLFYNNSALKEKKFSEKECKKGSLGKIIGKDLLKKVGFAR